MDENLYYNGTKLINIKKDADGLLPEIFAVDGNRTSGKTTYFYRWFVNRFKKHGEKFMLIYRYDNELGAVQEQFWNDIHTLFFPDDHFEAKKHNEGAFYELFLNDAPCGYAVSLNGSDKLKKFSHIMTDTCRMFFDEFQSKKYIKGEAELLYSLHTSVARGHGQPVRYVPVYMACNHVSSLNPYYRMWHCASEVDDLQEGFYLGHGFVIEKNMNYAVAELQKQSGFNRAYKDSSIYKHTIENDSLLDNKNFVEEVAAGDFRYLCTIEVDGQKIALREVRNNKNVMFYFSDKIDPNHKVRYAVNTVDHSTNTVLLGRSALLITNVKRCFEAGYVRFSSLEVKGSAFEFLMIMI